MPVLPANSRMLRESLEASSPTSSLLSSPLSVCLALSFSITFYGHRVSSLTFPSISPRSLSSLLLSSLPIPDGKELFEADSESSSIRAVNLQTGGSRLLAGGDPNFAENLFKVRATLRVCLWTG